MEFNHPNCQATITFDQSGDTINITGRILDSVQNGRISYIAAAPIDRHASFTGSGLPFPNADVAFENSPNKGSLELMGQNRFDITITKPNAYYVGLGTVYVPPHIYIRYNQSALIPIELCTGVPFRTLTYPSHRKDASFYEGTWELPVRDQEDIIRSAEMPYGMQKNNATQSKPAEFWGLKPRV